MLNRLDPSTCFGIIGVGSSFCFRRDCKTLAHLGNKHPLSGSEERMPTGAVVAIQRSASSVTAFSEPVLNWNNRLPAKSWMQWEGRTRTLQEWNKEFQAVLCSDADDNSIFNDIEEARIFVRKAEFFKTPAKRKREAGDGKPQEPLDDDEWVVLAHNRKIPTDPNERKGVILDSNSKSTLFNTVTQVETSLISLGSDVVEIAKRTRERFRANERDAIFVAGVIQAIRSGVGSPPAMMDPKYESPTLWGTTAFLADELTKFGITLEQMSGDSSFG